jgi:hypothetical protein
MDAPDLTEAEAEAMAESILDAEDEAADAVSLAESILGDE